VPLLFDVVVAVSFDLCSDQAFAIMMILLFSRDSKGKVANR
jgi:hypothetical protein